MLQKSVEKYFLCLIAKLLGSRLINQTIWETTPDTHVLPFNGDSEPEYCRNEIPNK